MNIRLISGKVNTLSLVKSSIINSEQESELGKLLFGYQPIYQEDDPKSFSIEFQIKVLEPLFTLEINAEYNFKTDEDISNDFKLSHFPKINAPAISFPFLRALVNTILINSGYSSPEIPPINFVELSQNIE
jgi:preprotein translocase subunit SecB